MKEIIGFKGEKILVSDCDYESLNKFTWSVNKGEYTISSINKKNWLIHRYIMIELLGNKELTRHNLIDHINGNRLDNTRENLRIVTPKENAKNKNKAKNSSSKYFGVIKYYNNQFQASITINKRILAYYKIEEHAAYQYDLWIKKYKVTHTKINNIKKPKDFIEYIKKEKGGGDIPRGIVLRKSNNTYFIKYKGIHYRGSYKTVDEAKEELEKNLNNFTFIIKICK